MQRYAAGALCALLLLSGSSWPTSAGDAKLTALLLVARDNLPDPDFAGSVVLVMNNLGPAPVGIIIVSRGTIEEGPSYYPAQRCRDDDKACTLQRLKRTGFGTGKRQRACRH